MFHTIIKNTYTGSTRPEVVKNTEIILKNYDFDSAYVASFKGFLRHPQKNMKSSPLISCLPSKYQIDGNLLWPS